MSKQSFCIQIGQLADLFHNISTLSIIFKPNAGHTGIYFNMYMDSLTLANSLFRKLTGHGQLEYCRTDIVFHHFFIGIREYKSKDQDRFFDACLAKQQCLLNGCHCISPDIIICLHHLSNWHCAMPITICLHNSYHLRSRRQIIFHAFKIICHCIQIDLCTYSHVMFHCLILLLSPIF